ncbi:MAG TPA: DUF2200 family protein [Aquihabitans sp.]|nr:DUF2200 family protein [Aquihabitans sp.]
MHRIFTTSVSSVYPHYVNKLERKGVQDVEDPLMQKIRYLDKLVDELAKGKAMAKVLRS